MYRQAIEELGRWKNSPHKKPLIIEGTRQGGKTWLVKEFVSNYYISLRAKSLKQFIKENDSKESYRLSLADYREEERIFNIPIYGVSTIKKEDYDS